MIFRGVCYLQTFISTFKNIFNVSDRSEFLYKYVIISSSLIPYQNFGPDLCLDCLLMLSVVLPPVVIDDQRDRQFQNRPWVFYQVARVVSPSLSEVCRNIIFNNVHII